MLARRSTNSGLDVSWFETRLRLPRRARESSNKEGHIGSRHQRDRRPRARPPRRPRQKRTLWAFRVDLFGVGAICASRLCRRCARSPCLSNQARATRASLHALALPRAHAQMQAGLRGVPCRLVHRGSCRGVQRRSARQTLGLGRFKWDNREAPESHKPRADSSRRSPCGSVPSGAGTNHLHPWRSSRTATPPPSAPFSPPLRAAPCASPA